jgi:hypothetical protein
VQGCLIGVMPTHERKFSPGCEKWRLRELTTLDSRLRGNDEKMRVKVAG